MYDDLVKTIRHCVATMKCTTCPVDSIDKTAKAQQRCVTLMLAQAADAIEELSKKFAAEHDLRVKALNRLCGWCGVCSEENRNAIGCDDIAQLDTAIQSRWISVEERLPETSHSVLVTLKSISRRGCVYLNFAACENGTWYEDNGNEPFRIATDRVTHWMPLPEPPKEEEE